MPKSKLFSTAVLLSVTAVIFTFLVSCVSQLDNVQNASEARDAALSYLDNRYANSVPGKSLTWQEYVTTPEGLIGVETREFISGEWMVNVSYPVVLPENTVYDVNVINMESGWHWKGNVEADGTVTQISAFQQMTEEASKEVAEDFVINSPTFVFDGIEDSFQLTETITLRCPYCWQFIFVFESAHAGYGDRTGQMLAQVITHHIAVITVDHLEVSRAVMDDQWDMLTQQMLQSSEEESRMIAEEFVRNSPTFAFDGIESSLILTETLYPDIENTWQFIFRFESRHSGYGDRTGQNLLQVITPHQAIITVGKGKVVNAIMDEKWDMLQQHMIGETPPPSGVPAAPNDSIVTAKVIDVIRLEGEMPWEIVVEIVNSEDVPGFNNATRARVGETIKVSTDEDVSKLEKGQLITAHVQLRGDEHNSFYIAQEITLSK